MATLAVELAQVMLQQMQVEAEAELAAPGQEVRRYALAAAACSLPLPARCLPHGARALAHRPRALAHRRALLLVARAQGASSALVAAQSMRFARRWARSYLVPELPSHSDIAALSRDVVPVHPAIVAAFGGPDEVTRAYLATSGMGACRPMRRAASCDVLRRAARARRRRCPRWHAGAGLSGDGQHAAAGAVAAGWRRAARGVRAAACAGGAEARVPADAAAAALVGSHAHTVRGRWRRRASAGGVGAAARYGAAPGSAVQHAPLTKCLAPQRQSAARCCRSWWRAAASARTPGCAPASSRTRCAPPLPACSASARSRTCPPWRSGQTCWRR